VLERVLASAARMDRIIEDLLALSRLGRQPLAKTRVELHSLVRRIVEELQVREVGRHVELRLGELPDCEGDPSLLEQVMVNLLSNAFKFTRNTSAACIEVGCVEQERDATPEHPGGAVGKERVYYVRDNGAGFDMRYAGRLFGVFQRMHAQSEFEGTGVGLSIAHRIVQMHGGRIWAESEPRKGAVFRFTLPGLAQEPT